MHKEQSKCLDVLHGFTKDIIQHRKKHHKEKYHDVTGANSKSGDSDDECIGQKKRMALLDLLIEASEDGKILSDDDIREEVRTHKTTNLALVMIVCCMNSNSKQFMAFYV
jgi:cytochrome P450 family 4